SPELLLIHSGRRRALIVQSKMSIIGLVHSFDWKIDDGSKIEMDEAFGLLLWKAERLKPIATPRLEPIACKD
ncbi:hypothetical protein Droror1_Dr00020609, partial [Drosera rotundifolia]